MSVMLAAALYAATVETSLNPTSAQIGDTLRLEMQVQGAKGRPILFPKPSDPFALLKTDSSALANGRIGYTVAVYDTGRHLFSNYKVIVGRGADAETLWTSEVSVTINSILPDTAQTPLPLKPYRTHPFQWRELLGWLWIPIVLIIGFASWWVYKRYFRKGAAEEVYTQPLLPPDEEAIRGLITLKDQKYPARGMLKEFFSEYSQIMRRYLERRYTFPALEMTTYELAYSLEDNRFPKSLTDRLLPSLRHADLVKFAKHIPAPKDCDDALELGFELIAQTKPVPQPETVSEEKAA